MKNSLRKVQSISKSGAKIIIRKVVKRLPQPKARLTGTLAVDGGSPVRNIRFRPWSTTPFGSRREWLTSIGPVMRRVFTSGIEGLPQPLAKEFADKWAGYCGSRHALLLPHGTDALRIAIAASLNSDGLDYGGEIIVPNLSFVASATAALDRRFAVALVDVHPKTLNLDPARVEEAIRPGKTRAIMAVHLFGQPADLTALRAIAKKHSLVLIEDAAQAHGAIHELGKVGGLGDVAGFSFQTHKNLPSGEGGALTTNDSALFERAYGLHNVGRRLVGGLRWGHDVLGWNIRPSEYVAAVLLHRLKTFEAQQQTRWERFQFLRKRLEDLSCIELPALGPGVIRHGVHMFPMRYHPQICGGLDVDSFLKALQAEGIPAYRAYEKTMFQQPALNNVAAKSPDYVRMEKTPVADEAVKQLIYIPHHVFLSSETEVDEVAAAFRKVEAHYSRTDPATLGRNRTGAHDGEYSFPSSQVSPSVTHRSRQLGVAIIGAGFMGLQHGNILSKTAGFEVVAVSDVEPKAAHRAADLFRCKAYDSAERLIEDEQVDVIVIATPHWQHADLATLAFAHKRHVICEKPLTVTVDQADKLVEAASKSGKLFAVVHQTRFEPSYQLAKGLLESGELGGLYRCSMVESAWRTAAYYCSSSWRGTWRGEGGGVLLNQAPHVLDRYAWLCGMPETVLGRCDTNLHAIEVEDTVSAVFRHASGAHGMLHVNTVEAPAISHTELCCDRGKIALDRGQVTITRLKESIKGATRTDTRAWGDLATETSTLEFGWGDIDSLLADFYRNFAEAVEGNAALVSPGHEGLYAVELANAILLSSYEGRRLELPLSRTAYSSFIDSRIHSSNGAGN